MELYLFKVVARFGLDSELDSTLYWKLSEAKECAKLWLKQEDCDEVTIYFEEADKNGSFRTKGLPITIKRKGE